MLGSNISNLIMKEVSSLVTDGTSVNIGHNNGLWKIFQNYILEKFSEPVAPLLIICCSAHKSSLAASNEIPEIKNILITLSGISSYFAKSEVRCREFKNIAEYNNLIICSFPKIFEIRWSE